MTSTSVNFKTINRHVHSQAVNLIEKLADCRDGHQRAVMNGELKALIALADRFDLDLSVIVSVPHPPSLT